MKRFFTQLTTSLLLTMAGVLIFPISSPAANDDDAKQYQVKMNVGEGGKVVASATQAPEGASVSLWTYVKEGYQRKSFTVTTSDGQEVEQIPIVGTSTTELLTNGKCDGTFGGWEKTDGGSGWGVNNEKGAICWASSYYTCTLWQTMNLTDYGISDSDIDNGDISCSASAEMMSIWEKNGQGARVADVKVEMQDGSGNVIKTVTVLNDLSYIENWKTYDTTFKLVSGTRILRYVVRGQDAINWNGRFGPAYRNLSLTITSTGSETGFTMPAADVTVNAVFSNGGGGTEVTATPKITYEITDDACVITAKGDGEVKLYIDGTEVENPYTLNRTNQDQTVTITATAQEDGKEMSTTTAQIEIPKKEGGGAYTGKVCIDNIYYNLNGDNKTAEVTYNEMNVGYLSGDVVIPEKVTYEGVEYTVTAIGDNAFYNQNYTSPSTITIPGTVKTIGDNAFKSCGLTIVEIPEGVTTIGNNAFYSCTIYEELILPSTLTSIGTRAFAWSNQTRIFSSMENPCEITGDAFDEYRFESATLYVPAGTKSKYQNTNYWNKFQNIVEASLKQMKSADGTELYYILYSDKTAEVTNVKKGSYSGNVNIPEKVTSEGVDYIVTSIGSEAFENSNITSVTIPGTVTTIGSYAFYDCENIKSLSIGNGVTTIGYGAFASCSGLTTLDIPGSVTTIKDYAFDSCTGLTTLTIPKGVTSIGANLFWGCAGLTSMKVESGNANYESPDGSNAIIEKATNTLMAGCKSTIIPNTVTTIGSGAFGGMDSMTSIDIPNSVTSIGEGAFSRCTSLTSVTIPSSVTTIGEYAFSRCTGLTSIDIPNSVTSIGKGAFYICTGLASVNIPTSVTSIENYTFFECTALTSVEIPSGVTSIGTQAFSYCEKLSSVIIPASVTNFGESVFYRSNALKEIHCQIQEPIAVDNYFFSNNVYTEATLYVPKGTKEKYQSTASWNKFTNIVEEDVTAIDKILPCKQGIITVYDLKGRRLPPSQMRKGHVYIINGKKVKI